MNYSPITNVRRMSIMRELTICNPLMNTNVAENSSVAPTTGRDIEPGGVVEVDVTVPDAGALAFFCKFHAALGQRGQIEVARAEPAR